MRETIDRKPSILEQVRLIGKREADLMEADVPLGMIYREDVPTDAAHVRELAEDILREQETRERKITGQNSPVSLAHIPEFGQFPIMDGFHRVGALYLNDASIAWATIRLNSSWEDVVDQRILAASQHRTVRFARIVEWIEQAWDYSSWSDRLNALQAFQLFKQNTRTNLQKLNLREDEAQAIRDWVERKCEQWHIKPFTVRDHLSVARMAAPELIKETRERKSGNTLDALTPQHLKAIAAVIPYRHDIQVLVAEEAKRLDLTVPKTRALGLAVSNARSTDEAREIIKSGKWNTLGAIYSSSRKRELIREVEKMSGEVTASLIESLYEGELKIAELLIENALLSGRYDPPNEEKLPPHLRTKIEVVLEEMGLPSTSIEVDQTNGHKPLLKEQLEGLTTEMFDMQPHIIRVMQSKWPMSMEEAEDHFSEMMIKAIVHLKGGRLRCTENGILNRNSFISWCITTVFNTIYDRYRRRGVAPSSLDNMVDVNGDKTTFINVFERESETDERINAIKRALPYLSENYRRILILSTVFDLPYQDIAQILMSPALNVRIDSHRARRKVTDLIAKGV